MTITSLFFDISLFVSLFFEVFLLITYFEIRDEIKFEKEHAGKHLTNFPTVTIIVPCYNEEKTVGATIHSLLALDYPADKLSLVVVDDGSTDHTQKALDEFRSNSRIQIFTKTNGGKHTALNFALEKIESDLVGCLDADSFVDPEALKKIVGFFDNSEIMAVTPSIKIHEPKTVIQHIQKVEYGWGILMRRLFSSLNALYVTPGPFSIFRTRVFREIGGYREAHQTEDMEFALRMHTHHYKIVNSHGAYVYTTAPKQLPELYRQRVRWTYGFLNNAFDYRKMFFNSEYGNISFFVLPIATFSVFSTIFAAGNFVWGLLAKIPEAVARYQAVGYPFSWPHFSLAFDWFSFNTGMVSWVAMMTLVLTLVLLGLSLTMANGKFRPGKDVLYYLVIYIFIVPLWLTKAVYATVARKSVSWR
jgi:cellulose synthase/poly-beta-1,6-N-acetylglucosamine synthase-like glycosyltransferase